MSIPTNAEIRDQIMSYTESRLGQTLPRFQRSFVYVLATAVSGPIGLVYRFVDWALKQTQPATANEFWLGIWATRYDVPRGSAVAAVLTVSIPGTNGTVIDAGVTMTNAGNGLVYQVQDDATISGGAAVCSVKCLTAGESGNLANSSVLALVSPISGAQTEGTVTGTTIAGVDRESVASWRSQVMLRIAYSPQGGAIPDYVQRALEYPGVAKALVDPGSGDVIVYPLANVTGGARVPDSGTLALIEAWLTDPAWKPIGANVTADTTTERTCAVTITTATVAGVGLTASQKAQVVDAVTAALYASYPKQYPNEANPTDTIDVGMVWDAMRAIGATAASITINVSGIGGGPYVLPVGEIIKIGTVTWA